MKSESCTQVLEVLSHMEEKYQYMVPERLMDLLKQNMSHTYHFEIDMSIPLWEQNLDEETLSMLALINLNYWCKDEAHKQDLLRQYAENDRKYSEEKRLEYREILHSLGDRQTKSSIPTPPKNNTPTVKKDETPWEKVLSTIKNSIVYEKIVGFVGKFFS